MYRYTRFKIRFELDLPHYNTRCNFFFEDDLLDMTVYTEPAPTVLVGRQDYGLLLSIVSLGLVLSVKISPSLAHIFVH